MSAVFGSYDGQLENTSSMSDVADVFRTHCKINDLTNDFEKKCNIQELHFLLSFWSYCPLLIKLCVKAANQTIGHTLCTLFLIECINKNIIFYIISTMLKTITSAIQCIIINAYFDL